MRLTAGTRSTGRLICKSALAVAVFGTVISLAAPSVEPDGVHTNRLERRKEAATYDPSDKNADPNMDVDTYHQCLIEFTDKKKHPKITFGHWVCPLDTGITIWIQHYGGLAWDSAEEAFGMARKSLYGSMSKKHREGSKKVCAGTCAFAAQVGYKTAIYDPSDSKADADMSVAKYLDCQKKFVDGGFVEWGTWNCPDTSISISIERDSNWLWKDAKKAYFQTENNMRSDMIKKHRQGRYTACGWIGRDCNYRATVRYDTEKSKYSAYSDETSEHRGGKGGNATGNSYGGNMGSTGSSDTMSNY